MASSSSKTKSSSNKLYSYSTSNAAFSSPSPNFASSTSSSTFFNKPHTHTHSHQHQHHHQRSASPTRVNLSTGSLSNFQFSIDQRSISPNRTVPSHVISKKNHHHQHQHHQKKTCMCSPTTHPGSFRCSIHKNSGSNSLHHGESYPSNRLNMRRSAMKNSLVRIGGVEGEWVKRALTALIRPSSHQQKRRDAFEPRSSRLSVMSKADE